MTALVGLVIVSHSRQLADGVVELAGQMAPGVPLVAAGGMPDSAALAVADVGAGAVVLFDLGSAQMTADMAVETLDDPTRAVVAQAPLVEGAVAAAVAAAGGADLATVVAAAEGGSEAPQAVGPGQETEIELTNDIGLHARPAALLARSLTGLTADVTVRLGDKEADARSVLGLLGLAARKGDRLVVSARGEQAAEAITRIRELADKNFGE
jgi:PTS hybrid protein